MTCDHVGGVRTAVSHADADGIYLEFVAGRKVSRIQKRSCVPLLSSGPRQQRHVAWATRHVTEQKLAFCPLEK
jgi:hypothetical protein